MGLIERDELDWATLSAAAESHEDAHGVLAGQEAREAIERLRTNHRGAVEALQSIYDRHHMTGDGSAGKVSGDVLRALGFDPDRGQ